MCEQLVFNGQVPKVPEFLLLSLLFHVLKSSPKLFMDF